MVIIKKPPLSKALGIRHVSRPEQECFDWFLRRSCIKLPGLNIPQFWKSTLLQASTTEAPVMHAVMALGALHLTAAGETLQGWHIAKLETFMLAQYSQALHHLNPAVERCSSESLSITLITGIVFVYFEFLRSNYQTGCTHLHFLLRLLSESEEFTIPSCGQTFKNANVPNRWVLEPILRLYLQAQLIDQLSIALPPCFSKAAYEPVPAIFNTLHHARWYFDLIIAEALHLRSRICRSDSHDESRSTIADTIHSATQLKSQLTTWQTSYAATMAGITPRATPRDHFRYAASTNFYRMGVIILDSILSSQPSIPTSLSNPQIDEAIYDTHTHHFLSNLRTAISQYRATHTPAIRQQILGAEFLDRKHAEPTIDQGWLHHLLFTALKCRVHRVRHHALRLMRTSWHKEGVWDTEWVVRVAEEVVGLEEGEFFHGVDEGEDASDKSLVQEEREFGLEGSPAGLDKYGCKDDTSTSDTPTNSSLSSSTPTSASASTSTAVSFSHPPTQHITTKPSCPCKFELLTPPTYNDPEDLVTLPVERRLHDLKIRLPEGLDGVLVLEYRRTRGLGSSAVGSGGAGGWVWERRELVVRGGKGR